MSYTGYKRIFHDYDGRTRVVIKEATNPKDIADWVASKGRYAASSQIANTECPKCQRNTTGALKHVCP